MRHLLARGPLPGPVAALALGMAMPPSARRLVALSGRSNARPTSCPRATPTAVALAPITTRAHPHLAPAPGTHEQPGIVHLASREEDWTIPCSPAILTPDPYVSADLDATPGTDRQVFVVRGCVGLPRRADLTRTRRPDHRRRDRPLRGSRLTTRPSTSIRSRDGCPFRSQRPISAMFAIYARFLVATYTPRAGALVATLLNPQHGGRSTIHYHRISLH